ncbi:TPA: hypothetical protein ACXDAY_002149 [Clostridium botulinum]|uniref:hypothetical protein n=1 Tax=Clostridium botulinum TaxID=1491 RepID=UPI0004B2480F|nr:hypothetical protein [Clostridium botulinum]APR02365.1 hypothetical protein RSJ2_4039 [Clostridium botulinum]
MKTQEQIEKRLINILRKQADSLEKGDTENILIYKTLRQEVCVLEDILELNVINR